MLEQTVPVIVSRFPDVIPHLKGRASVIHCETKATQRDEGEPVRKEKVKTEKSFASILQARLERQLKEIQRQLEERFGKTISTGDVYILDDEGENSELIRLFYEALLAGTDAAAIEMGIYLADGAINERALNVARTYVTDWLRQLDEVSARAVRNAVQTFIQSPGTTIGDMINLLNPLFGETRAARIAVTETTRVFALANDIYAQELRAEYPDVDVIKQWYTNNDDRVCAICGPLNGKTARPNESFAVGIDRPPAHVNCRCWTSVTVKA